MKNNFQLQINYKPHPAQKEMHDASQRFRIAVCGRRFGKTTFALAELIFNALFTKKQTLNWYVAPTYRQAKQIAWVQLQKMIPPELIIRKHEMELSLTLYNQSKIELKGTDNPDSLRGVGLDLVVLDEFASMKLSVWEEILRPTIIDTQGEAIFIGTPKGYNHFYDLYLAGQPSSEKYDQDFVSWRKPTSQNPYIPREEIEKAKMELTEDAFAQEFLADFRHHTGRVYSEFDRLVHVIPPFDTPSSWIYGRYLDRGWRVPTGVGFCAIDENDNWYIIDEIYETGLTNPQLANLINGKSTTRYFWHSYADSAQASDIEDLRNLGCYFEPVKKQPGEKQGEWIRAGIEKIAQRLMLQPGTGKPQLFVFSNCVKHIFEFENYEWEEKKGKDLIEFERPKKRHDHLMDGLRYFGIMYKTAIIEETSSQEKIKDWTFE